MSPSSTHEDLQAGIPVPMGLLLPVGGRPIGMGFQAAPAFRAEGERPLWDLWVRNVYSSGPTGLGKRIGRDCNSFGGCDPPFSISPTSKEKNKGETLILINK